MQLMAENMNIFLLKDAPDTIMNPCYLRFINKVDKIIEASVSVTQ